VRSGVIVLVAVAGCSFPGEGATPEDGPLPPGGDGPVVVDGAGPIDTAPPGPIDAGPIDARAADAAPFVCSTAGLQCVGQPAVIVSCGNPGDCWVGCTNGGQIQATEAEARCATWGGRLNPIYTPEELTCVRAELNYGAVLLGLTQSGGASGVGAGWSWNGDGVTPSYLPWDTGQPNDGTGTELGFEQCAYSPGGGDTDWHDAACSALFSRFGCRYP
jgi:hypothetical protein